MVVIVVEGQQGPESGVEGGDVPAGDLEDVLV